MKEFMCLLLEESVRSVTVQEQTTLTTDIKIFSSFSHQGVLPSFPLILNLREKIINLSTEGKLIYCPHHQVLICYFVI